MLCGDLTMGKVCTKCKEEKPLVEFSKQAKAPDGLRQRCKLCIKAENADWYLKNREDKLRKNLEWQRKNPDKMKVINARGHEKRKGYYSAHNKEWYKKNKDKPEVREWMNKKSRARFERVKRATPNWLSAIEIAQMEEFYDVAKARSVQTGERYEVDHIVPLRGDAASGLHVPWNLQIVREDENLKKGNRVMEAV
jgi:hypothetical protein